MLSLTLWNSAAIKIKDEVATEHKNSKSTEGQQLLRGPVTASIGGSEIMEPGLRRCSQERWNMSTNPRGCLGGHLRMVCDLGGHRRPCEEELEVKLKGHSVAEAHLLIEFGTLVSRCWI